MSSVCSAGLPAVASMPAADAGAAIHMGCCAPTRAETASSAAKRHTVVALDVPRITVGINNQ